jgi:hypothetical protein
MWPLNEHSQPMIFPQGRPAPVAAISPVREPMTMGAVNLVSDFRPELWRLLLRSLDRGPAAGGRWLTRHATWPLPPVQREIVPSAATS